MKKLLVFIICAAVLLFILPVAVFAEGEGVVQEPTLTEQILAYAKEHLEEIAVVVYIFITSIYERRKQKANFNALSTVNNNAVTVSQNSQTAIDTANANMIEVKNAVTKYDESIQKLLSAFEATSEEKKLLEAKLNEVTNLMNISRRASLELANEVAELLVLANIPNAKKEELYARHRAAVEAIAEAEKTEVTIHESEQETE